MVFTWPVIGNDKWSFMPPSYAVSSHLLVDHSGASLCHYRAFFRGQEELMNKEKHCNTAVTTYSKRVFSFRLCPEDTVQQTSVDIRP